MKSSIIGAYIIKINGEFYVEYMTMYININDPHHKENIGSIRYTTIYDSINSCVIFKSLSKCNEIIDIIKNNIDNVNDIIPCKILYDMESKTIIPINNNDTANIIIQDLNKITEIFSKWMNDSKDLAEDYNNKKLLDIFNDEINHICDIVIAAKNKRGK